MNSFCKFLPGFGTSIPHWFANAKRDLICGRINNFAFFGENGVQSINNDRNNGAIKFVGHNGKSRKKTVYFTITVAHAFGEDEDVVVVSIGELACLIECLCAFTGAFSSDNDVHATQQKAEKGDFGVSSFTKPNMRAWADEHLNKGDVYS